MPRRASCGSSSKAGVNFDLPHEAELANSCVTASNTYFRDVRGFAYDEVRACMAAGWTDLLDL